MKNVLLTILLALACLSVFAQASSTKIKESEVPKPVKDAYDNSVGFPVDQWIKLTVSNGPRYVAVTKQMNPSSGKTLVYRYRYNGDGKSTSYSQYRGNGKGELKDFYKDYTATDDGEFEKRIAKLLSDNTLVSFEEFDFTPGNQTNMISTHRFVLTDKNGKRVILYFDKEGKEFDISKYTVRKEEAQEID